MPSGLNDTVVDAVLDKMLGASADTSLLGATLYMDLLVTAPSDDNGTGAVSWGQGRLPVTTTSGTNWPAASGRVKAGATQAMPTNASGAPITVVAVAFYTASTAGTYQGGGPVPGGAVVIAVGATPTVVATLTSPSP